MINSFVLNIICDFNIDGAFIYYDLCSSTCRKFNLFLINNKQTKKEYLMR